VVDGMDRAAARFGEDGDTVTAAGDDRHPVEFGAGSDANEALVQVAHRRLALGGRDHRRSPPSSARQQRRSRRARSITWSVIARKRPTAAASRTSPVAGSIASLGTAATVGTTMPSRARVVWKRAVMTFCAPPPQAISPTGLPLNVWSGSSGLPSAK